MAVIPARSGSKGIKDKNIRSFCGKPLIFYAIQEAKKCKNLDRIIVSTDSWKYAEIAKKYGAEVPFLRPKRLAGDKSPVADTILHLLDWLKRKERYIPDHIVLLQTTSPLRIHRDIERCTRLALKKKCDVVISVCSADPYLLTVKNNYIDSLTDKRWLKTTNRQQLPCAYRINGPAVLITKRNFILKSHALWGGKMTPYFMEKWRSLDLDDDEDFKLAELLYRRKNKF